MTKDFNKDVDCVADDDSIDRPLKVLLISLFHPELIRGGSQQVCYDLFRGLSQRADVLPTLLAAVDNSFPGLQKSGARITGFDGRPNEFLFLSQEYDYWWHRSSNYLLLEAYAEFLKEINPDIIHFHHFLMLGIDLIALTRKILPDAKIVFTFHEFMTICAADGHMVRKTDKSLCIKSSAVRCHQCFPDVQPEQFFLRDRWMKKNMSNVDVFTTPSKFMIKHYIDWGINSKDIFHIGNKMELMSNDSQQDEIITGKKNRFGFFGQLIDAKGVVVILRAVEYLRSIGFSDFIVEINGDNIHRASPSCRDEINNFLENEKKLLSKEQNVIFNGSYQADQIGTRMTRIDWCIVPSVWWEVFCLVISEAWIFGRPVIASDVGGPAERITHNKDGLLFPMGDHFSLAKAIKRACSEDGLWNKLNAGIQRPDHRDIMVSEYIDVYTRSVRE